MLQYWSELLNCSAKTVYRLYRSYLWILGKINESQNSYCIIYDLSYTYTFKEMQKLKCKSFKIEPKKYVEVCYLYVYFLVHILHR